MGALSGNSVLPLNINNLAILISCVGLRLFVPPPPPTHSPKKKKKKRNAKEFCRMRHVKCAASRGSTTAGALLVIGTKQKTISAEDKD